MRMVIVTCLIAYKTPDGVDRQDILVKGVERKCNPNLIDWLGNIPPVSLKCPNTGKNFYPTLFTKILRVEVGK